MVLHGTTYRTPTPLGTAYITINENGDEIPLRCLPTWARPAPTPPPWLKPSAG